MTKGFASLLKHVLGEGSMPIYIPQDRNGFKIEVVPNDLLRQIIRAIPFYNGTTIILDLILTAFKGNKITEDFNYEWELYDESNIVRRSGSGNIALSELKVMKWYDWVKTWFRIGLPKNGIEKIRYSNATSYKKYSAIKITPLLKLETFQLRLKIHSIAISSEEIILMQFDTQNVDEMGKNLVDGLIAAVFGAIAGLLTAVIYLAFFGSK